MNLCYFTDQDKVVTSTLYYSVVYVCMCHFLCTLTVFSYTPFVDYVYINSAVLFCVVLNAFQWLVANNICYHHITEVIDQLSVFLGSVPSPLTPLHRENPTSRESNPQFSSPVLHVEQLRGKLFSMLFINKEVGQLEHKMAGLLSRLIPLTHTADQELLHHPEWALLSSLRLLTNVLKININPPC